MLKPVRMNKVSIFLKNNDVERLSGVLYDLGIMELMKVNHESFSDYDGVEVGDLSNHLLELRSTIRLLEDYYEKETGEIHTNSILKSKEWFAKLDDAKKKILHLEDEIKRKRVLDNLKVKRSEIDDKRTIIGYVGLSERKLLNSLGREGKEYRVYRGFTRYYFITKIPKEKIKFSYREFFLLKESEENLKLKLKHEKDKLEKIESNLRKISNGNINHLKAEEILISKKLSIHSAKDTFAKTNNFTVMSGHVPRSVVKRLQNSLTAEFSDKYEMVIEDAQDDAPVKLNHSRPIKNFEALLSMYSFPKYKEIDPTVLMFWVFPIFFGFILGDFGYGLISLIFFTILKYKMKSIKNFMSILQISAVSSMLFGIFYGEYFGFEPHLLPFEFHRSHDPQTLLIIALIFGLVHINMGLIVGFVNNLQKSFKKAVCDSFSWILLQIGIGAFALGKLYAISVLQYSGIGIALISLYLIYLGHGFIGIMEVPSFFTNIFSYARLMAVGLSSIAIAVLVNEYSVPMIQSGFVGAIFGILLFTVGHVFNIVLGNFEGFLHTLRLHYVEFFTKFYSGGGKPFEPFGRK